MNFIKWFKYPIVFNNMTRQENGKFIMSYAGNLIQSFDPKRLLIDDSGHFLHPLDDSIFTKFKLK